MTTLFTIPIGLLFISVFATSVISTNTRNFSLPKPGVCGISVADRIVGGHVTALNAYPWAALIGKILSESPQQIVFICGGSLISDRFVLTAAHCFVGFSVNRMIIRLGEWDIERNVDCYRGTCSDKSIDVRINNFLLHEYYDAELFENDIALIKLPIPVAFTEFVSPVCLPLSKDLQRQPKVGKTVTAIGWGITERGDEKPGFYGSWFKKETNFPVVNSKKCQPPITKSQFCVKGNENSQTCFGDSGGSVVAVERDGYWYQYGVVSASTECGAQQKMFDGKYTRVSYFLTWIMAAMAQLDYAGISNME